MAAGNGIPLVPGAYMSSLDRGVWLLEKGQFGMLWRMPGGFTMVPSAAAGPMYHVVKKHLPFRRMAPIKRRES